MSAKEAAKGAMRHAKNWLRLTQMACGVSAVIRTPVKEISELTCERCILRLLRTGQALGWSEDDFAGWDLSELERLWTKEKAEEHAHAVHAGD
jgi:hypothetical protein